MRKNLNEILNSATRKNQIEDMIVHCVRPVYLESHWDASTGYSEKIEVGDTFKIVDVTAWPWENDGRGCVKVQYYDDCVEEQDYWADAFEIRR